MAIKFARANGEICEYKNAQYLPAFFLIPEEILKRCGKEIYHLPRTKRELLYDKDAIAMVESDLFRLVIIDAFYIYGVAIHATEGETRNLFGLRALLDTGA